MLTSSDLVWGDWTYAYDATGERVGAMNAAKGLVRTWLRDEQGHVLVTYVNGSPVKESVFGGSRLIGEIAENGDVLYALTDHLGSTRMMVDSTGTPVGGEIEFSPFGGFLESPDPLPTTHLFTGHERDLGEMSGLDYMHARYYSSDLGRFLSVDPVGGSVGSSQSWNRYSYVLNNPVKFVDPDGRQTDRTDRFRLLDRLSRPSNPRMWYVGIGKNIGLKGKAKPLSAGGRASIIIETSGGQITDFGGSASASFSLDLSRLDIPFPITLEGDSSDNFAVDVALPSDAVFFGSEPGDLVSGTEIESKMTFGLGAITLGEDLSTHTQVGLNDGLVVSGEVRTSGSFADLYNGAVDALNSIYDWARTGGGILGYERDR